MKRIALVIHSLSVGGAQRVLSRLASSWDEKGYEVAVITLEPPSSDFFPLRERVRRISIGLAGPRGSLMRSIADNGRRILALRRALRGFDPDLVLSFIDRTNVLALLATVGWSIPVIVSERSDPARHESVAAWHLLRRLAYRRAWRVVVQSSAAERDLLRVVPPGRIRRIPNWVPEGSVPPLREPAGGDGVRRIVAVGAFRPEKQLDLLLRVFSRCAADHPDWSVILVGDGPERPRLEALIRELGLGGRVEMPGLLLDPAPVLATADLYVLSSRYEVFPNVLLEAMAAGVPPVAFDCPSGPREIIRDGIDGILVPPQDADTLAGAIERLLSDEAERLRLAAKAVEVRDRFSARNALDRWDELLAEAGLEASGQGRAAGADA